ncbi:hypothetical protein AAHA92_30414 [Salvia divinorum]|uniref:Uncharacterized protein n=1 Tax=Salvia divinorum TaxID=28513 RepID=A0ABD1FTC2_SALDI
MKSNLSVLASLILALALILHTNVQGARAGRSLLERVRASTSATESLQGLDAKQKNPYKKEKSSFRRVPPSRSNPTQNKSNRP